MKPKQTKICGCIRSCQQFEINATAHPECQPTLYVKSHDITNIFGTTHPLIPQSVTWNSIVSWKCIIKRLHFCTFRLTKLESSITFWYVIWIYLS